MAKLVSVSRGLWENLYLPELLRGLGITMRHFFINFFTRREIVTMCYPEEMREPPPRFRGVHRLMRREDGTVRCVACMMCSTICPANCIHIVAGERQDQTTIEKYPVSFDIDELVCVVCGLCVEACPCDAIRMDTGTHMPPVARREQAYLAKDDLLKLGTRSIALQGGAGPNWRANYQELAKVLAIYDRKGELSKKISGS